MAKKYIYILSALTKINKEGAKPENEHEVVITKRLATQLKLPKLRRLLISSLILNSTI